MLLKDKLYIIKEAVFLDKFVLTNQLKSKE